MARDETPIDRGLLHPPTQLSDKWRLANIVLLGVGFMLLFTAFQTGSMVEESVLEAAKNEPNSTFTGSGYTSLSIIYGTFAVSNWIAPSVVAIVGPKVSMIIGGIAYCLFIASFLKPMAWALYLGSVLVGFGAAVIWTGQGNFLTINSDGSTIGRNSGIFWALLQMSLLAGNLYVYFALQGESSISANSRFTLYTIFTALGIAGVVVFFFLRMIPKPLPRHVNRPQRAADTNNGAITAFKSSLKMLFTRNMVLLSLTFAYTGFELTFWSGVYGTSVGHTQQFGSGAHSLIGMCGIFIGIGEIIGGVFFGLLGKRTNTYGRSPIVLLGFVTHMIAFYLIFLILPSEAPLQKTSDITYIDPNEYVAVFSAFLLGFGDSSFNTQLFSLLGFAYAEESASAFALYKFVQSLASAIAFAYSSYLLLQWQLAIMVAFNVIGTLGFFLVEWDIGKLPTHDGYSIVCHNDD
ncbi:hypothetical protein CAPTEDRAFT_108287 [Capitella teleta]|uniref:UNC93-like protein MFSD11 n=1 Tax=Capitella teleta TaxID=283909 RepID=R7TU11_CAPTE|nr:hypothetical protein CAPTEDRAFT_108287 [Capitella teleta]|eukprot:ELT97164.1 hypothetical protein CAPTEDRAFT_108287 [Capitella teleta]